MGCPVTAPRTPQVGDTYTHTDGTVWEVIRVTDDEDGVHVLGLDDTFMRWTRAGVVADDAGWTRVPVTVPGAVAAVAAAWAAMEAAVRAEVKHVMDAKVDDVTFVCNTLSATADLADGGRVEVCLDVADLRWTVGGPQGTAWWRTAWCASLTDAWAAYVRDARGAL